MSRNRVCSAGLVIVAAFLSGVGGRSAFGQPAAQAKEIEDRIPVQATVRVIPVDLGEGKWPRTFYLRFCRNSSGKVVFVFPVFVVKDITFKTPGGKPRGLFDADGRIAVDFLDPTVRTVTVEFWICSLTNRGEGSSRPNYLSSQE